LRPCWAGCWPGSWGPRGPWLWRPPFPPALPPALTVLVLAGRGVWSPRLWPARRLLPGPGWAGVGDGIPKTAGLCREILKIHQVLWIVVRHEGVEPTNHAAERAIRPGVLWRKGSFGTQSPEGSRVVETMMTVVATLKQQHRHVLAYVAAACETALRGEAAPSLLPAPAVPEQPLWPAA